MGYVEVWCNAHGEGTYMRPTGDEPITIHAVHSRIVVRWRLKDTVSKPQNSDGFPVGADYGLVADRNFVRQIQNLEWLRIQRLL